MLCFEEVHRISNIPEICNNLPLHLKVIDQITELKTKLFKILVDLEPYTLYKGQFLNQILKASLTKKSFYLSLL